MEVGEPRVQRTGGVYTLPFLPRGLLRQKTVTGQGRVPVVELVHRHLLPGAAEEIVLSRRGGDVAEPRQPPRVEAPAGNTPHHIVLADGLRQIHEATALGDTGHPPVHRAAYLLPQSAVFLQPRRVKLRIAAA